MNVVFATIERQTALEYIKKALSSYEINEETAKPVLDMVSAGKIRVGDPMMYGSNIPIFPEKNYEPLDNDILAKWMSNLNKKSQTD